MRNRKLCNQIMIFLCAAVTLLMIHTVVELWKIQIRNSLQLEYAMLQKNSVNRKDHLTDELVDRSDFAFEAQPPPEKAHKEAGPLPAADKATLTTTTATRAAATMRTSAPVAVRPTTTPTTKVIHEQVDGVTPEWTSNMSGPLYIYPQPRNDTSITVHIVIIMKKGTSMDRYKTARQSVECYGALHGYTVSIFYDDRYPQCAVHRDFFFKRHCNVHLYMKEKMQEDTWLLFIDSDVGVVNPRVLIESFMQPGFEIYLIDRFYNWEYAAYSYLVKNNDRGRSWVNGFATFESQLPNSFHGTDNGALHPFMMFYLVPETQNVTTRSRTSELCLSIWNRSKNWDDVFAMEACTRMVIGERINFPEHKVKIYPKGYGWSRDIYTLHSHWADDDFMMHAVKETDLKPYPDDEMERRACHRSTMAGAWDGRCYYIFPVLSRLNTTQCAAGEPWLMEGRLRLDVKDKRRILDRLTNQILRKQMNAVGVAKDKILNV